MLTDTRQGLNEQMDIHVNAAVKHTYICAYEVNRHTRTRDIQTYTHITSIQNIHVNEVKRQAYARIREFKRHTDINVHEVNNVYMS